MPTAEDLRAQLFRLVYLVRCAGMKRAISQVNPQPHLNFWRLILGSQLDAAVLEWCKVFGSHNEATHWTKAIAAAEQDSYRQELFATLGVTQEQWIAYWEEMKAYRDNLVAHHIDPARVARYPNLDLALRSAYFHYGQVLQGLGTLGENGYPGSLENYYTAFEEQARTVASAALAATAAIPEEAR